MANMAQRVVRELPVMYRPNMQPVATKDVVCAYTRVSTDFEEQEMSFELQCDHYTKQINARPDWEFGGIYADHGKSGTRTEKRSEFMRMIEDCRKGKINKILVKSISRFARNTVDTLKYVRELKELGVSVFFETQNIDTMTANGEVLITILAAMAEQESRTISSNIKWSYEKRFKEGRVILNCGLMLGYEKDEEGNYVIKEDEDETVRRVFREYIMGATYQQICDGLMADNKPTGTGGYNWKPSTVQGILKNEKYTGNAILGKTFKRDVLSKSRQKNQGQAPSYYVENSHPAIITQEMFEMAQLEKEKRSTIKTTKGSGKGKYTSQYPLSGLLVCTCGSKFRRHARPLADGTKVITWLCITHQKDGDKCDKMPLKEEDILNGYAKMMKDLTGDMQEIKAEIDSVLKEVAIKTENQEIHSLSAEIETAQKEMMALFRAKQKGEYNNETYSQEYATLSEKLTNLRAEEEAMKNLELEKLLEIQKLEKIEQILTSKDTDLLGNYIMKTIVEKIIVIDKHTLKFELACGIERTVRV